MDEAALGYATPVDGQHKAPRGDGLGFTGQREVDEPAGGRPPFSGTGMGTRTIETFGGSEGTGNARPLGAL